MRAVRFRSLAFLGLSTLLLMVYSSYGKDKENDWQGELYKWTASSQTDPNCKARYVTGVYRPDFGANPVWGFMTQRMFEYLSKDGAKEIPSVCPSARGTQEQAQYRILLSMTPMRTVSLTMRSSETLTNTQPFSANVTYSNGSSASIQGQETTTTVVPTETTISRSSAAMYMYTYRVSAEGWSLISTDSVVFSRVSAVGTGSNAAGAELGAGIGNAVRASKDRHRADKLYREALLAIRAQSESEPRANSGSAPVASKSDPSTQASACRSARAVSETPAGAPPGTRVEPATDFIPSTVIGQGIASVTSNPVNAEIFVDSIGRGHAPNLLKLTAGKHRIQLVMDGFQDWVTDIEVREGSILNVTADLAK